MENLTRFSIHFTLRFVVRCQTMFVKNEAKFWGQLRALFQEPLYVTSNIQNIYSYCISATAENEEVIYLMVYSANTGPAIGGKQDPESRQAAEQLREYILEADPVDYDYEGIFEDGPMIIKMGVKNGIPYYEEKPMYEYPDASYHRLFEE